MLCSSFKPWPQVVLMLQVAAILRVGRGGRSSSGEGKQNKQQNKQQNKTKTKTNKALLSQEVGPFQLEFFNKTDRETK